MKNRLLSGMMSFMVSATAMARQSFSIPDQVTDALTNAISEQDESAVSNLLGKNWRDLLPSEGVDPDAVDRFLRDQKVRHNTVIDGNTTHLMVGDSDWQLPIPVIKNASDWQFGIKGAIEEILTHETGRSELAAIEVLHTYVDAQQSYSATSQGYVQKIVSSRGKKDGLCQPVSPGEASSPLGSAFSPQEPSMGYHGYRFQILPDKTSGFAMVVWPVNYDRIGVMNFIINGEDRVYQADLDVESR